MTPKETLAMPYPFCGLSNISTALRRHNGNNIRTHAYFEDVLPPLLAAVSADRAAATTASDIGTNFACSRFQCGGVSLRDRLRERDL